MKTGLYLGEIPIGKVVVAVAGENGIQLQEKTVTPSKGDPIVVTPDIGIDGLSKVTVEPIPDAYIDTTTNNAPYAGDMLKGTVAFANTNKIEGALEGKDILEYSADGLSFENGDLIVSGTNTERAIVKAEADVSITIEGADLGNATTADVLNGKTFTSENGLVIEGTMADLGNISATLDSITKSKIIPAGYTAGGEISLGTNVVDTTISSNAATASTMLNGKQAYVNGELVTGNIATKTSNDLTTSGATVYVPAGSYTSQASKSISSGTLLAPSISVSSSGVITATSGISTEGYLSTSASKSNKKSLTTQSGKTVTPSTSTQTAVSSNRYTTGTVYVAGDSNLVSSNIKSGVSIFGVDGSYSGGEGMGTDVISIQPTKEDVIGAPLIDTTNLTGFVLMATSVESDYKTFGIIYNKETTDDVALPWALAIVNGQMGSYAAECTVTIGSNYVMVNLDDDFYPFDTSAHYFFFPIYGG